jgi:zinc/manganese transport system permease protein
MIDTALEVGAVLAAPLVAGLLALISHVPLGEQVLQRGIVFIDLAIAQIAALGVLVATGTAVDAPPAWWAGTLAALLAAGFVAWLARVWPAQREALIGLVYVGGAAAAILWVSSDPHGAQKLRALLAGDILWVRTDALLPLAVGTALFALLLALRPDALRRDRLFYPAFAALISLSVPVLGLYLVFAMLIAPALGARSRPTPPAGIVRALPYLLGMAGLVTGLAASYRFDTPSGPTIVLATILVSAVSSALSAVRLRG